MYRRTMKFMWYLFETFLGSQNESDFHCPWNQKKYNYLNQSQLQLNAVFDDSIASIALAKSAREEHAIAAVPKLPLFGNNFSKTPLRH